MRILTIGDIHGRSVWEKLVNDKFDKIVFIGDYVDSFTIYDSYIISNLLNILQFKKDNPDVVELLWGNHELQYLFRYSEYGCSGFRENIYLTLHQIFNENKHLLNVAFQIDNYLWTHAGVTSKWYERFLEISNPNLEGTLADKLNMTFNSSKEWVITEVGKARGGTSYYGGPLWADKSELDRHPLSGYNQIVGHTKSKGIQTVEFYETDNKYTLTYCDCLDFEIKGYTLII